MFSFFAPVRKSATLPHKRPPCASVMLPLFRDRSDFGAQTGRWELLGAAGLAGRPGALGSAPGLPEWPLRRQDGQFNCICVHLHDCSFNELYVFLIVFKDKKCTFFPLHAYNFMYECMDLMRVKVCRHA